MIQDLISELAAGTVESGGWPELQPFLFQAVQSGQDAVVEVRRAMPHTYQRHGQR